MDPSDPAAAALSRILTLLDHTWVRDFIFPKERQPDLLHLAITSAQQSPYPSTGIMQIATLPTKRPEHSLDETMKMLFVPSFTTGDITVGFQVHEKIRTNTVNTNRFYLGRTVRDDAKGMFLAISEQALLYSFYSIEQKPCMTCLTTQGTCKCVIPTRRKRAPNDFDIENLNMKSYCGEYDGLASVGTYWNGCKVASDEVCSRVEAKIARDDGLVLRLAQWGMKEIGGGLIRRMEVHPVIRAEIFGRGFDTRSPEAPSVDETITGDGTPCLEWIFNEDEMMIPLLKNCDDLEEELETIVTEKSVPIAPAGIVVDNDRPLGMDEREWKKELKKRRNRVAAHRSNEKKKQQLQMMKQEIEQFGRRVNLLREREERLKKENRGLKDAVVQL